MSSLMSATSSTVVNKQQWKNILVIGGELTVFLLCLLDDLKFSMTAAATGSTVATTLPGVGVQPRRCHSELSPRPAPLRDRAPFPWKKCMTDHPHSGSVAGHSFVNAIAPNLPPNYRLIIIERNEFVQHSSFVVRALVAPGTFNLPSTATSARLALASLSRLDFLDLRAPAKP